MVYTGWFWAMFPFSWCNWTFVDLGNGNYTYSDSCGGSSSYLDLAN